MKKKYYFTLLVVTFCLVAGWGICLLTLDPPGPSAVINYLLVFIPALFISFFFSASIWLLIVQLKKTFGNMK